MSISIKIQVEPEYVCLLCRGTYSMEELKRVYQCAVDAALDHAKPRVLIDAMHVTGEAIPTVHRYELSQFLTDLIRAQALGKINRFALCGHEPLVDPGRFGETVAINRGLNAKVTTNREEALAWLNH